MPGVGLGRRRWKRSKPAEVNWGNPLTEAMVMCVPCDRVPFTCLVTGRRFTMDGNPLLNSPNTFGAGVDTSSTTKRGGQFVIGTADRWSLQPPITVGFAGTEIAGSVTNSVYVGTVFDNVGTAQPYVCYGLVVDTTHYRMASNDGLFFSVTGNIVSTASRAMRTQVGVRQSTTAEIWVNGRREGQITGEGSTISYSATSLMCIGSEPTAGRFCSCSVALCAVWDRALSQSEIAAFDADPMQLLR